MISPTTLTSLAKVELHCHLDGSLSLDAIRHLAKLAHVWLPDTDQELKSLVTAPVSCQSLNDYLKTFGFIRPLLQTQEALRYAAYDVAKTAAAENVIYIEVRFAPELSMDKGLDATQVVSAVCQGLEEAQRDFKIVAKALICGLRQSPPDLTTSIFDQVDQMDNEAIVGYDFAGNEADYPPKRLADMILDTKKRSHPMTFHAGECGCPNYIQDAMDLGIQRLGHVTALSKDPDLLAEFVKKGVHGELCLVSNLHTKAAKTLADFPYLLMKEANARLSINTDNRTVSDTSLTREYSLYVEHFGVTIRDFYNHNLTAIEDAFASPTEKKQLIERLNASYKPHMKETV